MSDLIRSLEEYRQQLLFQNLRFIKKLPFFPVGNGLAIRSQGLILREKSLRGIGFFYYWTASAGESIRGAPQASEAAKRKKRVFENSSY